MKQQTERHVRKNITNSFGSFGYLLCFLQWFWAVMLYFSVIQSVTLFVSPHADTQVEQFPNMTFALPDASQMIILAVVVAIMIAITLYVLIKMPMNIVKTSNTIVHRTAETMTPVVMKVQHKKDTKKFRAKITSALALVIKLLLIIVPVVLTAASGLLKTQSIGYSIAMIVGCGLAGFSVIFFTIQYIMAGLLHVKMSDLW